MVGVRVGRKMTETVHKTLAGDGGVKLWWNGGSRGGGGLGGGVSTGHSINLLPRLWLLH